MERNGIPVQCSALFGILSLPLLNQKPGHVILWKIRISMINKAIIEQTQIGEFVEHFAGKVSLEELAHVASISNLCRFRIVVFAHKHIQR